MKLLIFFSYFGDPSLLDLADNDTRLKTKRFWSRPEHRQTESDALISLFYLHRWAEKVSTQKMLLPSMGFELGQR